MNPHVPNIGIELTEYESLGPLFVGTVSKNWYAADYHTRLAQLERLQQRAEERGSNGMVVMDPTGCPVASWSRGGTLEVHSSRHPT